MSLFKGNTSYDAARELQEAFENDKKQKYKSKKWITYLFLISGTLILVVYLTDYVKEYQFIKNSKKSIGKIKYVDFISTTDGSGLGSTNKAFDRIVYSYKVKDSVFEDVQDIYNLEDYIDLKKFKSRFNHSII